MAAQDQLDQVVFKDLFEGAFEALWIFDADMVVQCANQAAADLVGYDRDALVGKPLSLMLPAEIGGKHQDYVGEYLAGRSRRRVLGQVRRFEIMDAEGKRVPILLKAFRLPDNGGVPMFGAMMEDLRQQVALEQEQQELIEQLERMALTDALTGMPNRRAFFEALEREAALVKRHRHASSIAILDVDRFKMINDQYGHRAGDRVLQFLSLLMTETFRRADIVGRIGGEEFGIVFPGSTPEQAAQVVERALQNVVKMPVEISDDETISVAFSAGVVELDPGYTTNEAMRRADEAMYVAKAQGRGRVVIWRPDLALDAPEAALAE